MCSYLHDPNEAAREFAVVITQYAVGVAIVGLAVSLVASIFLLKDGRRIIAGLSLVCALLGAATWSTGLGSGWIGIILFLTLCSLVKYPTQQPWVNWPLLGGAGVLTIALVYMGIMQTTHPCAF